jgi:hypothetical protein
LPLDAPAEEQKQRSVLEIFHDAIARDAYGMAILRRTCRIFFSMHLTIRQLASRPSWKQNMYLLSESLKLLAMMTSFSRLKSWHISKAVPSVSTDGRNAYEICRLKPRDNA